LSDFGPYNSFDVSRNGRNLLLAGKKGHLCVVDWKDKDLVSEFHVKQLVRDVHFLNNQNMFAVA
jgi:U3 small nucleolar RNA-associated protein 7